MREDIKSFISKVRKPGRYTGGESGAVIKDKNEIDLRVAFCFPDIYEIGMSNLGMRILCGVLNEMDKVWCERVYAPWADMEDEMRAHNVPLYTHDSGDAVRDFDIMAITLQYELCYSTALDMIDLAGLPLYAKDRGDEYPVVLAGGPCAYNAEPMADFIDIFSIGEGEEALPELAVLMMKMKKSGTYTKEKFLHAAACELEGFYVPSLYEVNYNEDGMIASLEPKYADVPKKVKKRLVSNVNKAYVPTCPILPNIEAVQDRITLEVFRGCIRGCRFCQAGFISRPVREKSPEVLWDIAKTTAENSGYDEISLSSLSISDYSQVGCLTDGLLEWTNDEKINLSLPSLRADSFTKELMDKISTVRTSTLTFAPEAGTQRLRDVINKNVTEEDILRASSVAFGAGKSQVKLYFMDGLPYETYDDIAGIAELAHHVVDEYYRTENRNRRRQPQVTLSVACFIPKPHTPFQWEGQDTLEELEEKQKFLSSKITDRKVKYNYHDAKVSRLEAIFARGDRRLSEALYTAQNEGIKLDAWSEFFNYDKWMDIFARCGVDTSFYANRDIGEDEILPWDMIDCGVSKEFMIREHRLAKDAATTPSCKDKCSGCGANGLVDKKYCRWCPGGSEIKTAETKHTPKFAQEADDGEKVRRQPVRTVRIRYEKRGVLTYVSHLDFQHNMMRALLRAKLPLYYTEGFNPIPKLAFASPLSVGCAGERELADIKIMEEMDDETIMRRLSAVCPDGIRIVEVYTAESKFRDIKWAKCTIEIHTKHADSGTAAEIGGLFNSPVTIMKRSKSGDHEVNISPFVKHITAAWHGEREVLEIDTVVSADTENYLNPDYVAAYICKTYALSDGWYTITRSRLLLEDGVTEYR